MLPELGSHCFEHDLILDAVPVASERSLTRSADVSGDHGGRCLSRFVLAFSTNELLGLEKCSLVGHVLPLIRIGCREKFEKQPYSPVVE